ncbi:GH17527 [Drosophila grimshawi]|uniref:GH11529 n=1 Tax=Drosophila grimshawi TaxID=7222 RepID=B4JB65_DROGR|nr:GH11529 [Drosophila grimshawi]EDW04681.1 GH17527 [Drosophila grimshawi]
MHSAVIRIGGQWNETKLRHVEHICRAGLWTVDSGHWTLEQQPQQQQQQQA